MKLQIWGGIILFAVLAGGVYAIWFYDEQHSLWVDVLGNDVIFGSSTMQGIHRLAVPASKQALDQGNAVFVDVRSAYAYEAGHIPGALHLPLQTGTDRLRRELATHPTDIRIITYCSGGGCRSSYTLAKRLVKELIRSEIYVMTGGWPAWRAAGFPITVGVETGQ